MVPSQAFQLPVSKGLSAFGGGAGGEAPGWGPGAAPPAPPHRPGIREVRRKLSSVYSATRNQALLLSRNGSQAS